MGLIIFLFKKRCHREVRRMLRQAGHIGFASVFCGHEGYGVEIFFRDFNY